MQNRRLLATATLTALVLSVGILQPAPIGTATDPAPQTLRLMEDPTGPRWAYAWGMNRRQALLFALAGVGVCAGFSGPGAAACGVAGAL